ncbi:MAG: PD-(D/E)XK nuclease family protein [Candidatus Aenigmatarchaeota archaeon]
MTTISASDLNSWNFCPRQVYFRKVLGIKPEKKEVMIKGTIKHSVFEKLIESYKKTGSFDIENIIERVLSEYTEDFEKFGTDVNDFREDLRWSFDILGEKINKKEFPIPEFCERWIESEELGLKARVDVIFDESGEWVVGDLKTNVSDFLGPKLQIGAGALLFEKHMNTNVNKIKIISHNNWAEKEIDLTGELRRQIHETRKEIDKMLESKEQPPLSPNPNKCAKCDFWETHCNPKKDKKKDKNKPSFWERVFG